MTTNTPTNALPDQNSSPLGPTSCPSCHITVRNTDYFCFNCGHSLREKPIRVSLGSQFTYYIASLLFPPLGIVWGIRFIRKKGPNTKLVGIMCIVITLISLALSTYYMIAIVKNINEEVIKQTNALLRF